MVIGNQRLGRQTLVFKNDPSLPDNFDLSIWMNALRNLQSAKPYIAATFVGNIVNTANTAEASVDETKVDEWGIPVTFHSPLRNRGNGFKREFVCSGIVGDSVDNETYTPENVDEFIVQFIKPKDEFGEVSNADDFAF